MKKWVCASLVVVALLVATVVPGDAGGRGGHGGHRHGHGGPRVFVGLGLGPAWWYGHPYYHYPYWYYPPPYVYAPSVIQQPLVYVEQQPVPPADSAPAAPQQYWYYCEPGGGYYPSVPTCAQPWIKVPPRAQP